MVGVTNELVTTKTIPTQPINARYMEYAKTQKIILTPTHATFMIESVHSKLLCFPKPLSRVLKQDDEVH